MNNRKEGTENGASQRESVSTRTATKVWNKRVLCNKGVQLNTSTAQQVCSATKAQVTLHTEVQLLVGFLLAQGKFDVFNLLTECSIRGKLALDFLTTVEDGGMVTPTQFTPDLRQRHIRKLLT